nr:M20/M25/M40 family metallo-hydrolase [Rhizobiaceae bacterium]
MSRTLELLDSLIAFPTVSADTNLPLIDWAQDLLSACGARVHRMHDETGLKAGLYAEIGPDSPGGVVLSAHSDVVPVAGQNWTRPPFRLTREDDRVFGRGTTDMKGFVACMLAAAERASRGKLAEPLKLSLSWDEEVGCIGVHKMLPDLKARIGAPRLCIVGEPTGMQAAIGHKGKAAIRADCTGENGHSAMAPHFVNALHLACDFVAGLRAMQNDLAANGARDEAYDPPCTTVHAGRMNGGRALNIVPDSATVDFEFRHIAADAADAARARGEALGPLHGVPVTTKINVDQRGCPTDNGIVAYKDAIAAEDSPVVANLRHAGA